MRVEEGKLIIGNIVIEGVEVTRKPYQIRFKNPRRREGLKFAMGVTALERGQGKSLGTALDRLLNLHLFFRHEGINPLFVDLPVLVEITKRALKVGKGTAYKYLYVLFLFRVYP